MGVGKDVEMLEPWYLNGGKVKWWCTLEHSFTATWLSKNRITWWSNNSTPEFSSQENWNYVHTIISRELFTAALFIIPKTWKQFSCLSMDDWINKVWNIYPVEYYMAVKKKALLTDARILMNLKILMLNEGSQGQKTPYYMITSNKNAWGRGKGDWKVTDFFVGWLKYFEIRVWW